MKRPSILITPLISLALASCATQRSDPYDTGNMYGFPDAGLTANEPGDTSLYETPAVYEDTAAPDLSPADTSSTGSFFRTHTVARGDTLSRISTKYNVKMSAIIQANNIKDKNMLSIGQKLIIPAR